MDDKFVDNRRFIKLRGFDENGNLAIGSKNIMHKKYRTHFGWNFAHDGLIYGDSSNNLMLAMRRLFACRNPLNFQDDNMILFFEDQLRLNQSIYIDNNADSIIKKVLLSIGEVSYYDDKVLSAVLLMYMKHKKRLLRVSGVKDVVTTGNLSGKWIRDVQWKLKLDEIAKPGKYPRVIVDLGVVASLECAEWCETMKYKLASKPIVINNWCFHFCINPEPEVVIQYLLEVWHNPSNYNGIFVAFSDDGILGMYEEGEWRCSNTDIKTCDASHTPALFDFIFKLFDAPDRIINDFKDQMLSSIRIQDNGDKSNKNKAFIKPTSLYLQSGSTITTLCNTVAQLLIFHRLADAQEGGIFDKCLSLGYIVTLEECKKIEDLQFLKMSPTLGVDGEYHACLNLGVILRASGTCRGDIPKIKGVDLEECAARFQNSLISGLMSRIDHEALCKLAPYKVNRDLDSIIAASTMTNVQLSLGKVHRYNYNIYNRYSLTIDEIIEFEECVRLSSFGSVIYNQAVHKILKKDYGLSCPIEG